MDGSILRITHSGFHCTPKRVTTSFEKQVQRAVTCLDAPPPLPSPPLRPLHVKSPQVSYESAMRDGAQRNTLKQASVRTYRPVRGGEATVRVLRYTSSLLRSAPLRSARLGSVSAPPCRQLVLIKAESSAPPAA